MLKNNFNSLPILQTKRLKLRQLQKQDLNKLFDLKVSPETNLFIKREIPKTPEALLSYIEMINEGILNKKHLYWAMTIENKLIGTICLWNFSKDKYTAEIGYELHPDYHKKGFMNEALQKIVHFGFSNLQLKAIEAFTHKNNKASKALLEKNLFTLQVGRRDEGFENNRIFRIEKTK